MKDVDQPPTRRPYHPVSKNRMDQTTTTEPRVLSLSDIPPDAWDGITPAARRSPKLTHDWARFWAASYSRNGELRVIVAGPADRPDAIVPLWVEPGFRRWHHFVPNDDGGLSIPCRDPSVLPAVAAALIRLRVPVDLGYYPAGDPAVEAIRHAARGRAKVVERPQDIAAAPWLDLDPSWIEPTDNLRRNMRQSLRRNERRMNELGALRVAFLEPGEDEVDALLDTAVAVEAKSWKDRTGTALTHDARQQDFFRAYARHAAKERRMQIALLSLDGKPIAMSIGEISNDVFWHYKIGYDEAFAKFGPGALLQYYLIGELARRGISRLEMQGQLVPYKRNWTDLGVETVAVRIYPFNPRGIAAAATDALRQRRKRAEARRQDAAKAGKVAGITTEDGTDPPG